jgi:hypothetical protein
MRVFVVLSTLTFLLAVGSGVLFDVGWRYEKDRVLMAAHSSLVLAVVALVSTWVYIGVQISHWM